MTLAAAQTEFFPPPTKHDVAAGYRAPYETRQQQTFLPGQVVQLGPRYVMGGTYETDGWEGLYIVDEPRGRCDYLLRPQHPARGREGVVVRCTRLQLLLVPRGAS